MTLRPTPPAYLEAVRPLIHRDPLHVAVLLTAAREERRRAVLQRHERVAEPEQLPLVQDVVLVHVQAVELPLREGEMRC